jgi:hypothetical protein
MALPVSEESGIGAIVAKHRETGIATGLIANMDSIFTMTL